MEVIRAVKRFTFLILFFFFACEDDTHSGIPLVDTNISISINDPAYSRLTTVGGWEYLTGGSRGILVYRITTSEFKAYDRHCTFQPSSTCALISVAANNITASCDCCGSKFSLLNGSVTSPPANSPLQEYRTYFDGNILRITN